jgi:hypothetical protein
MSDREMHTLLLGQHSLRTGMTSARDQGFALTCASFGLISCLEYGHARDLSEACITHEAESTFGDCLGGAHLGNLFVSARDSGTVLEAAWGYDPSRVCWSPPPDVSREPRFKFGDIWQVYGGRESGFRRFLSEQGLAGPVVRPIRSDPIPLMQTTLSRERVPICASVPTFYAGQGGLDANWGEGPDIQMPRPESALEWFVSLTDEQQTVGDGWHAIAICGYDDSTQRFEFKNSWGMWGDLGFGTIPYDYIRAYCSSAFSGTV